MTTERADDTAKISVSEEVLSIDRRDVVTGRVRVDTATETLTERVSEDLASVEATVTRVAVDRTIGPDDPLPVPETRGDVFVVPILEEVLVVERKLVLREELHVEQHRSVETVTADVPRRRQTATVTRIDDTAAIPSNDSNGENQ